MKADLVLNPIPSTGKTMLLRLNTSHLLTITHFTPVEAYAKVTTTSQTGAKPQELQAILLTIV